MKSTHPLAVLSLAAFLLGTGMPALAGEGHDHGDATPVATGKALPRFAAVSETFELVGVLDGKQVTLYLDRFADNTPVRGAKIDLEIAGAKFSAQSHGDDAYEIVLKEAPKPGVLPITATVTAGSDVDLLAGELDLHEARTPMTRSTSTRGRSTPAGLSAAWPHWRSWCSVAGA